jgi:AraC-like DNA-binding protein
MTWQGSAFLGTGWAAFRGASAGNSAHAHPSLQIALSHIGLVTVHGQQGAIAGQAVVVAPNVVHTLQPADYVTLILVEPQTHLARYFADQFKGDGIGVLDRHVAANIRMNGLLPACLDDVIASLPSAPLSLDPRVESALALLQERDKQPLIGHIAQRVGISTSRLRVIAKQHLGVSLSDWIIWRKLERAGHLLAQGSNIANAAYGAGFADQSHFARAMRSHFGITAKMISNLMN